MESRQQQYHARQRQQCQHYQLEIAILNVQEEAEHTELVAQFEAETLLVEANTPYRRTAGQTALRASR